MAPITIRNIYAVIQAFFRKGQKNIGSLPIHIYEQMIWRRTQVMSKSPECWEEGHCKLCGCEILGKTMEDRGCSANEYPESNQPQCYPDMMSEQEWKVYKSDNKIKLFD